MVYKVATIAHLSTLAMRLGSMRHLTARCATHNMASLSNKVFVVTGAASGMGLTTAKLLLTRGASVGLGDLNKKGLESFLQSLGSESRERALTRVVDVTDRSSVANALRATKDRFGKLHGIANFAGVAGHKLVVEEIWDISDEEFGFIIDANVKGAFHILAEGLKPGLLEEKHRDDRVGSSIVHVTSMFSERGYPKGSVFTASKHAAVGMVKAAAMEAGSRGIRVNALLP